MRKIVISMFSTISGKGYKGAQLDYMIQHLCRIEQEPLFVFALGRKKRKFEFLTKFPLYVNYALQPVFKLLHLPRHYLYFFSETLYGLWCISIMRNKLLSVEGVYFTLPRPKILIDFLKKNDRKIIMEFGECHYLYYFDLIQDEYRNFGIASRSPYACKKMLSAAVKAAQSATKVVALSEFSRKTFIEQGFSESQMVKINLGLKSKLLKTWEEGKPTVFFSTASHSFIKGTHRLLIAWREAKVDNKLILIGPLGEDLKEFMDKYGPFPNVECWGFKANIEDIYSNYNGIGILYSIAEGYPRSVAEYLNFGFPSIVTPPATCDLIHDQQEGFVIEYGDDKRLVQVLQYCSTHEKEMYQMSLKACAAARRANDYLSYAKDIVKLAQTL